METMIAYCGINCSSCAIFLATLHNDTMKKREISPEWSKTLGYKLKPEDIDCEGCVSKDGQHLRYCTTCEIRSCGMTKNVKTCAYCSEFPCEKLEKLWKGFKIASGDEAKANLVKAREGIGPINPR